MHGWNGPGPVYGREVPTVCRFWAPCPAATTSTSPRATSGPAFNFRRAHPEQAAPLGELHLAAALVRNCIGPFLDGQPASPLHLAVVGGAGAGKSTVVNVLNGTATAETNPQAGFTRHPIAYTGVNGV